jgi:multicomponent K+:H+ antiporter subunit E
MPYPIASVAVFVTWLLLNNTVAPAHLVLGGFLAVALPLVARPLMDTPTTARAPGTALRLLGVVTWDIVVSNITVAKLVLGPMGRLRPGFVRVPLDATHPYAISLLASIITMTPGTVSADVDETRREILVHVLDLADPEALVRDIKARYEAPLLEIFR